MKIRDKMLKEVVEDLTESYGASKQAILKIGQAIAGEVDPVMLSDLNYERGFNEGRLQTIGIMLNFFQDYHAKPLERSDALDQGGIVDSVQYDRVLQLAYHHLSAYAFEKLKEQRGEAVHKENIRSARQVILVLVSVLEIFDPEHLYKFFDGQGGNWTGIYRFKKGHAHEAFEIVLKIAFDESK